jgi:hypothetical protein
VGDHGLVQDRPVQHLVGLLRILDAKTPELKAKAPHEQACGRLIPAISRSASQHQKPPSRLQLSPPILDPAGKGRKGEVLRAKLVQGLSRQSRERDCSVKRGDFRVAEGLDPGVVAVEVRTAPGCRGPDRARWRSNVNPVQEVEGLFRDRQGTIAFGQVGLGHL